MNILRLNEAEIAFGDRKILNSQSLTIDNGERVVLIGRNGAGKSTLLKVLGGEIALDDGVRWVNDDSKIAYLDQSVPAALNQSIYEVVLSGLGEIGGCLSQYKLLAKESDLHDQKALDEISRLTEKIDLLEGWDLKYRVDKVLDDLNLTGDLEMESSSGGIRRRAMLAKALVSNPELLLLDEPTNHLDIESINELQKTLINLETSLVLVSHDRSLIDSVATRIVEIDRGNLISYPGRYQEYLSRKEKENQEELVHNKLFDKDLAKEESWIREGIKARRTRNEGRVQRLQAMRQERAERQSRQGNVKLELDDGKKSGAIVAKLENVDFAYDEKILSDFSSVIRRGDRVGIIGKNGTGKSTLLKLILGELEPSGGVVTLGTNLEVAYFDQQRENLDSTKTVKDSVADGNDYVDKNGVRKHVVGYLGDFLFPPHYMNAKVSRLSGGETNRLLLAKLFCKPANILVLDEPTNDLDIETLELLEELLTDFKGTILLVSHDRAFLDAIVTSTMVFEEGVGLREFVGGYTDWLRQRDEALEVSPEIEQKAIEKKDKRKLPEGLKRLGYKERRELEKLPEIIEQLERDINAMNTKMSDPTFYNQEKALVEQLASKLSDANQKLEEAYLKWEELSEREAVK
jgi:ATP-binding cassette subfamily F protein uup